jgi:NAD(P)H-dependent FMN reductase
VIRLLAVCGSLRAASTNKALLEAAARLAPTGMTIDPFDGLAEIPPFNPDLDIEPPPPAVALWRGEIAISDGLLISSPEYARGVPGALKNALDWLVASETFAGKPTVLINTSPRAFHAQASLREILSTMAARLAPEAFAAIPLIGQVVTADDILADAVCARRLTESLQALIAAAKG